MRLYQLAKKVVSILGYIGLILLVAGCGPIKPSSTSAIEISIVADEDEQNLSIPAGATAREAIEQAGLELNTLDKSDPPLYTILQDGDVVVLTRVEEEYIVEQSVIPYDTQVLRNESLPEGEERLIQPGQNGVQEITYRILYEDGIEMSKTISSSIVIEDATSEIVMIGSQAPFTVLPIPGILAYLSAGNAWIMRENTGVREPIVTTGDLDGRVFSISPNGRWLLYTRSGDDNGAINSLWVAKIDSSEGTVYDLGVKNIIHFADWIPGSNTGIVFSTAEENPGPPGWQANNDLIFMNFSDESGWTSSPREAIESNSGGLYGWWGTDFVYSDDGEQLAYSRPDGFGLVNLDSNSLNQRYEALSVQTRSDWAWIPPIAWSPDSNLIYFIDHVPQEGIAVDEDSQVFNLAAFPFNGGAPVSIVPDVGMFAYPNPSPVRELESGENSFMVAFLKAVAPRQSRTSLYQLMVMDRDGSNLTRLFPRESGQGITPHKFSWLPWYAVDDFPFY
nr:hypothetical protein [Fodinibius sp.]